VEKINGKMKQRRVNQMESVVKYENCSTSDR